MSLCKKYQCEKCEYYGKCRGCEACDGKPLGYECIAHIIVKQHDVDYLNELEKKIIKRINSLGIKQLFVFKLNIILGEYVNLEYTLPNGEKVKFLEDKKTYFANQIEIPGSTRCYGVVSDGKHLIVASYGVNGVDPTLLAYINLEDK